MYVLFKFFSIICIRYKFSKFLFEGKVSKMDMKENG